MTAGHVGAVQHHAPYLDCLQIRKYAHAFAPTSEPRLGQRRKRFAGAGAGQVDQQVIRQDVEDRATHLRIIRLRPHHQPQVSTTWKGPGGTPQALKGHSRTLAQAKVMALVDNESSDDIRSIYWLP
jgi:hypothetical protein